jgi:molecular chaperone DnaK (HSP70)
LWLIKVWFSASTFVVKIATFAKPETVKVITSKGASIPATFTTIVRTSYDNQTKCVTDIVYGEFNLASANEKLAQMTVSAPKKIGHRLRKKIRNYEYENDRQRH